MERLRHETRTEHTRLEQSSFFAALDAGNLELADYVSWLQALAVIHEAVVHTLVHSRNSKLTVLLPAAQKRLQWLDADLAWFHRHPVDTRNAAVLKAHVLAQSIRLRGNESMAALLGYLYVLEGSGLGGLILRAQAAQCFGLEDDHGLAYFTGHGKSTGRHWQAFSRKLDSLLAAAPDQDTAVATAGHAFSSLAGIIDVLQPGDTTIKPPAVQELNPGAGNHPVTVNTRELQAAMLAGEISWRRFPYYQQRYGERGLAFTRSDSAWLVQLTQYDQDHVDQQVRWLGRVLAARGMPRLLLERHLRELQAELAVARPERSADYARLSLAADNLATSRRNRIDDAQMAEIEKAFDHLVGPEWSARLPHSGALLASAVADEAEGIYGAVTSLLPWLTDPARFPARWVEAVHSVIAQARDSAASQQEKARAVP